MSFESLLYPVSNACRTSCLLDGLWRFRFDPDGVGLSEHWQETGLPNSILMPVPASFADLFTEVEKRDYCGDFWYETSFFVPEGVQGRIVVRFGSITHRARVFCNGIETAQHTGGFLPVLADVTEAVRPGENNRLVVLVNNEPDEVSLPCGAVATLPDGSKLAKPYYDFFNYSGIHRSVWLMYLPMDGIEDYDLSFALHGKDADVSYCVKAGDGDVAVTLRDADGKVVAAGEGEQGTLTVCNAHLWQVRQAYLYTLEINLLRGGKTVDRYSAPVGIRTVEIRGTKILVNGNPVYLKGFGKHEDFTILGRAFNGAVAKRDFECMKWTGANCFRTSHYPYAEEWYQMADEEGFLIIDEVPAVGMMRSFYNFALAGAGGANKGFFAGDNVPQLRDHHIKQVQAMIQRDKNHPCVFAWSLFNEPETTTVESEQYFTEIFSVARAADPQHRPMTGALEKTSSPEADRCHKLCDFICLNRYYGWYISGGSELPRAMEEFVEEMDHWAQKKLDKPFVFTEFGADTLASAHSLPGVMWSQEYQSDVMAHTFAVFDRYDFIQGELVWNFADFQANQGIMRVLGNKKGVFTRDRQPKEAAYRMKQRWEKI